jgi:hypothetical protein
LCQGLTLVGPQRMRLMRALAPADGFLKSLRMHEKKDVPQRLRRFRAYSFYGTTEQLAEKLISLEGTAFRPYVNALQ